MTTNPTLWDFLLGILGLDPETTPLDEAGVLSEPGG